MKEGMSIQDLARELQRQRDAKQDLIVGTGALDVEHQDGRIVLGLKATGDRFPMQQHAIRQACSTWGIPAPYQDRMLAEHPDLLAENLKAWFEKKPSQHLVRTLDGNARAWLSPQYRMLDNAELLEATLPVLSDLEKQGAQMRLASCNVSDSALHLKILRVDLKAEIPPAGVESYTWGQGHTQVDVVEAGIVIRNSEVGSGALSVSPAVHTVRCTNLAVMREDGSRQVHLGRNQGKDLDIDAHRWVTDEARAAQDRATWLQLRDLTAATLDGRAFNAIVARLRAARQDRIEAKADDTVQRLTKRFGLTETEGAGILEHLSKGGDWSRYGLHNAVTRAASDLESYDRASELERIGGQVIELKPGDWKELAAA